MLSRISDGTKIFYVNLLLDNRNVGKPEDNGSFVFGNFEFGFVDNYKMF